MRISVRTEDRVEHQLYLDTCKQRGGPPTVTVNGAPVSDIIVADEEAGYVLAVAKDEAGRFRTDAGGIITEDKRGAVLIRWPA